MKNLISMTDFVLEDNGSYQIVNYANFLKQPLELWMFFPCDEDGNVLEEPNLYNTWLDLHNSEGSTIGFLEHEKYKQAKERCLFENHDLDIHAIKHHIKLGRTVEYWTSFKSFLQLTPTALKKIGL